MSKQNISPVLSAAAPVTALFDPPIWLVAGTLTSLVGLPLSNLTAVVVAYVRFLPDAIADVHVPPAGVAGVRLLTAAAAGAPARPAVVTDVHIPPYMGAEVRIPPAVVAYVSLSPAVMADVHIPPYVVADVHVLPAAVADIPAALGVTPNSTVSTISIVFTLNSLTRPTKFSCRARNSHTLGILTSSPYKDSLTKKVGKKKQEKAAPDKFVQ